MKTYIIAFLMATAIVGSAAETPKAATDTGKWIDAISIAPVGAIQAVNLAFVRPGQTKFTRGDNHWVAGTNVEDVTTGKWIDAISVAPVGAIQTQDITGRSQWGAGLDLGVRVNPFVSIHVVNLAFEGPGQTKTYSENNESRGMGSVTTGPNSWGGRAIDETDLLVKARISRFSNESFTLYAVGSGQRDWNLDDWGFGVGLGAELSLNKTFSVAAGYQVRAWFNHDKDGLASAQLNISF